MLQASALPIASGPAREILPETRCIHFQPTRPFTRDDVAREFQTAARAGFNAVLFPVFIDGHSFFPSQTARARGLDPFHPAFKGRDPVGEAASLAEELGLSFWGFVRPYNFHPRYAIGRHRLLRRRTDWRLKIHPKLRRFSLRRREEYIACPANPDYRRFLGDLLSDLVFGYPISALVLNFTGFGFRGGPLELSPFCFCDACRALYAAERKRDLNADALDPASLPLVRAWQRERAHDAIEHLRHRILKIRRTLRLVCRVQPQWRWSPDDSGSQIQAPYNIDWNELIESGAVEELILDHEDETAPEMFRARLVSDLANLHDDAMLLPAIYVQEPDDLEDAVAAVRRYPAGGLVAEFAKPPTEAEADRIRDLYFAQPARSPDGDPLISVAYLLRTVREAHGDNLLISDFMRDFLRLIERIVREENEGRDPERGHGFRTLAVILQNLGGLQTMIRRGRLGSYSMSEQSLRDIGLARRIVRLACLDVRT